MLSYAYQLTWSTKVIGLPEWAEAPCGDDLTANVYEIGATMPPETTVEQARQMMQSMLADRFKLVVHWETKDAPIFALVIRSSGLKLKPYDPKNDVPAAPHSIGCPADDRGCHIYFSSGKISDLAGALGRIVGPPVIDKTGLTDDYDLSMMWASDTAENSSLPSLAAVLQEKFGLELKPQVGPVRTLLIDHMEKPSGN